MPSLLTIDRLFEGKPIISPSKNAWESGVTFNSSAVFLEATPEHIPTMRALLGDGAEIRYPNGIAVLHYRARPDVDPSHPETRSYIGISVHEPDLTLIKRFQDPVLEPGGSVCDPDFRGVEDPRVTRLDGCWWMVYCGVTPLGNLETQSAWLGSVCIARSDDLIHWTKCGAAIGSGDSFAKRAVLGTEMASISNKDGVLFPDRIDGKVYLLHRPMRGLPDTWATCLAVSDTPEGAFEDLGPIHGAIPSEKYSSSWVGAGAVPIRIGPGRYISVEHTGRSNACGDRQYVLDGFLYDFNGFDPSRPETLMVARLDEIMRPETDFEVRGPFHDSVANVIFSCGAYVHEGWLYIVYGGGDSFILAARLRFETLVKAIENRQ